MTVRQQEIEKIVEEIVKTEEKLSNLIKSLEHLSKLQDNPIEDEILYMMPGFPGNCRAIWNALLAIKEKKLIAEGAECKENGVVKHINSYLSYKELTVGDLISCSEESIASFKGLGIKTLYRLKEWMRANNLEFIG